MRGFLFYNNKMSKLLAYTKIQILVCLRYKFQAFIWAITDLLPIIVMFFYWLRAFESTNLVAGRSKEEIVSYYIISGLVTSFLITHPEFELSQAINRGKISNYLIRPMSYFSLTFVGEIAYKLVKLIVSAPFYSLFVICVIEFWQVNLRLFLNFQTIIILILSFIMIVLIKYSIGLLAFFFTEIGWVIALDDLMTYFISGVWIPLFLFPNWFLNILNYLPFKYYIFIPIESLLGNLTITQQFTHIAIQILWILIFIIINSLLWKQGVKKYSGYGN